MKIADYHIVIGNTTDVGKVRERNEDYMAHFETPLGYCVVVCDGMGGSVAGAEASQNAVSAIKYYLQDEIKAGDDIPVALKKAIEFANYKLREMVKQDASLKGMGTTCVLVLIKNANMFVAHAGDSRLYLVRKKKIKQITKDHSVVQNLIDTGALTEAEAEISEKKNQITKAIGIFEKVEPAVTSVPVHLLHNDKILLCSDGLTAHVNNESLNEIISKADDVQSAAITLAEKANSGGGTDNITVQLIHYTGRSIVKIHKRPVRKYLAAAAMAMLIIFGSFWGYNAMLKKANIIDQVKDETPLVPNQQKSKQPTDTNVSEKKDPIINKPEKKTENDIKAKLDSQNAKIKAMAEEANDEAKEKEHKQDSTARADEDKRIAALAEDSLAKAKEKAKQDSIAKATLDAKSKAEAEGKARNQARLDSIKQVEKKDNKGDKKKKKYGIF